MHQLTDYISKALNSLGIALGVATSIINYVLFPDVAYMAAAIALGGAVLVDIFSKYVAITRQCGGLKEAFRKGKIFSKDLWIGTKVKLQAYLSISIMVGLSYRLNSLPGAFAGLSTFMATVVYSVLFVREFQSILENFRDAGAENVEWLLVWAKDREKEILKEYTNIEAEDTTASEEVIGKARKVTKSKDIDIDDIENRI